MIIFDAISTRAFLLFASVYLIFIELLTLIPPPPPPPRLQKALHACSYFLGKGGTIWAFVLGRFSRKARKIGNFFSNK